MTMMTNSNDESRNDDTTNSLHFEEMMMMNLSVGGGGNNSSSMDGESESDQIEMEANELIEDINLYGMTAIPSLYDSIQLLSKYRDICTEKGEYELCRSITRLIDSIRAEKDKIRAREMYQQQMDDRSNIIEASRIEFRDAQVKWRDRMIAFRQELDVQLMELEKKHRTEMEEFTIQFHEDLRNRTPKFSKQLLQLRKVQETLAKQKDFDKALQLKKCADKQQNEELIRLSKENGEKFEKRKSILLNRQKQELLGVRTRALRDQREIELQRDRELKKLKQRFSNIKQTIEGQHSVLESKTRTFLSKFSYGGERSPNSCTPTTIFKNSDINNNNNSNSNSSNTLYHSTSSAIESRMMSSTSHSYSHNNINSVMYQSRPFSIPPSQNPITLSEITKSTATSILNYSQSPTLSHKKYSISEIFNSSSGSLSNRSKSSSPKRPRSSGSYSNRSSSSKASPTTPISQSHQYNNNNNASKSPSHFRPSTAKNRSVPLSPILHHSVSPNRHLNIPPIRIPDTVPDYF